MSSPHVLIMGAGLAGPALALALARHSIRSTIYERRAVSQDIGGVISLAPNAVRVLDRVLDVEPEIRKLGFTFDGIEMQAGSNDGQLEALGKIRFDTKGPGGISIKRPYLHNRLLELCEGRKGLIEIHYNKALSGIEERHDGVTAVFDDGSRVDGDIIIGADGIRSKVRAHVLGGEEHAKAYKETYTGHVVLGGIISRSDVDLTALDPPTFLLTQSGTILTFPVEASGDQVQWAAFLESEERDRKTWDGYRKSGQAIRDFKEEWKGITAGPIRTLLDSLTPENLLLWAPYATPDLPTWHTDRVCLIGDAAHAISPSAGQGTAQALEDVGLISRLLASPQATSRGYPALFAHYESARRKRLEVIRKMVDRTLANRAPTPGAWTFWAKKTGYKAVLGVLSGLKSWLPGSDPSAYDVTQEPIVV